MFRAPKMVDASDGRLGTGMLSLFHGFFAKLL